MEDIRNLSFEELTLFLKDEPKYRAEQIFVWLHQKTVRNFGEMVNVPSRLRDKCAQNFDIFIPQIVQRLETTGNAKKYAHQTTKLLFNFRKHYIIENINEEMLEAVFLRQSYGNTVCVSSQFGCAMGCAFCASAIGGKTRNCSPAEMLEQVYSFAQNKVSNVVIMGMGEPLDNYDNVLRFIEILTHEKGLNLSQRNVTLSTCGLVDKIELLSRKKLQITLAISLHAPNGDIRAKLMPIEKKFPFDTLLNAAFAYSNETGRRVSFEYALIDGLNDRPQHARQLAEKLKGRLCHVNLIPVNPVQERDFAPSVAVDAFCQILTANGVNTTVRSERGSNINAACGQLRRQNL